MESTRSHGNGSAIQWRVSCGNKSCTQCWDQSTRFLCLPWPPCPCHPCPHRLCSWKVLSFSLSDFYIFNEIHSIDHSIKLLMFHYSMDDSLIFVYVNFNCMNMEHTNKTQPSLWHWFCAVCRRIRLPMTRRLFMSFFFLGLTGYVSMCFNFSLSCLVVNY